VGTKKQSAHPDSSDFTRLDTFLMQTCEVVRQEIKPSRVFLRRQR
jgi:hypothetical protein